MAAAYGLAGQRRCAASGGAYVVALAADQTTSAHLAALLTEPGAKGGHLLEVLSVPDLRPVRSVRDSHGEKAPTDLAFCARSPSQLLSCGEDGAVQLWDIRTGGNTPQRTIRQPSPNSVMSISVDNAEKLCACAIDSTVSVLDLSTGKEVLQHQDVHSEPLTCIRFHPSRHQDLITAGDDGLVCVLDMNLCLAKSPAVKESGIEQDDDTGLKLVLNSGEAVRSLAFGPEGGDLLCTLSTTEVLQLWSLSERRLGAACGRLQCLRTEARLRVGESDGYVVDVLYDEDSGRAHVLTGRVDGSLVLYHLNLEGATFAADLACSTGGHKAVVRAVTQLGSNGLFATGGEDGQICLWNPSHSSLDVKSPQQPASKRPRK
eukprot:TRINITY_DN80387_c0_g1_i1.p1 TRINITY_DN80387_c0_g1~~TRINITY_DN80387_c0_g1_i1.p1  ORF type:complete len:374 (+),score=62.83 TRINITY_DN80387_c0_g1_i1:70-1191(+)